jgi:RHS repeat-associated protein
VKQRFEYSPFGQVAELDVDFSAYTGVDQHWNWLFHGEFRDSETGYYNYGYRCYNDTMGRWNSRDPIQETGGLNQYTFISNYPIVWRDFLGAVRFRTEIMSQDGKGTDFGTPKKDTRVIWNISNTGPIAATARITTKMSNGRHTHSCNSLTSTASGHGGEIQISVKASKPSEVGCVFEFDVSAYIAGKWDTPIGHPRFAGTKGHANVLQGRTWIAIASVQSDSITKPAERGVWVIDTGQGTASVVMSNSWKKFADNVPTTRINESVGAESKVVVKLRILKIRCLGKPKGP